LNRGNGPEFHPEMILDQILLAARKNKPFWTPAKAGIQFIHRLTKHLDSGDPVPAKAGDRSNNFLRKHEILLKNIFKLRK
jgi:hypothetical protein